MQDTIYPAVTLRRAAQLVRERLRAGFVPRVSFGGRTTWARFDRGRSAIDELPITPPEGVVIDELVFLQADEQAGTEHWHRLFGRMRKHKHRDGADSHSHVVGGPSFTNQEIVHP